MNLLLLAFLFLANKEKYKFMIIAAIASLFHYSALLSFVVLFIPDKIKSNKMYLIILAVAVVLNLSIKPFITYILNYIPGFLQGHLMLYLENEDKFGLNIAALLRVSVVVLGLFLRKNYEDNTMLSILFNIYFFGTIIYIVLGVIPELGVRGSANFTIIDIILLPAFFFFAQKWLKLAIVILYTFIAIYRQVVYYVDRTSEHYEDYVPYHYEKIL
jgi:hypothetical protein